MADTFILPNDVKNEKAEVSYWEAEYTNCEKLRKPYEEIWYMNLAFYFSKQWVVWQRSTTSNSRLLDPPTPRNRVRLISNRVKPIVTHELTQLIKEQPQFFVEPNTTEPTDVMAARIGESIAEFIIRTKKFNRIRKQATFWMLITGTGYMKITCSGKDKDIDYARVTPWHIFVKNLDDEDLETQPYIIHGRGLSKDIVEDTYNVVIAPDMKTSGSSIEQKFLNALGIKNTGSSNSDLVYVKEIWVKPCKRYKNGALLVIAGGKIIYRYSPDPPQFDEAGNQLRGKDGWPYEHEQYPFVKIDHTASGRFYGTSTLEDVIPLQKEYNKTRSQIIESKNRMSKPQMTYVKGSVDVNKITSEVGLYIPIQPGFEPPKPIVLEPLPSYVLEELNRITSDMDEISGRNAISRGGVPVGVHAAAAIAFLKEQNDLKIYNTVTSLENAIEDIGILTLNLVEQFWSQEKIVKIVSKNSAFEAAIFQVQKLNGNVDFRVEAGSMAPKSRVAHQAFIVDLMTKGIISSQQGLRYLQMNETTRLYEELQVDSKQAQRENIKMTQGMPVQVNSFDNDTVHIYEHELYMKSQEYEGLDPNLQQLHIQHLTETKQKVIEANAGQQPGPGMGTSNPAISTPGQHAPIGVG